MKEIKKIWMIAIENLMEWKGNYRIWVIMIVIAVVMGRYTIPVTCFSIKNNLNAPISIFPLLMADQITSNGLPKIVIFFGGIALLSNAPFLDEQKQYVIARSGRSSWWKGQCLYIIITSWIYILWVSFVTALYLLPVIKIGGGWGSLIEAVAERTVGSSEALNGIQCPRSVVLGETYWIALLYSYGIAELVLTILGSLLYTINLYFRKRWIGLSIVIFFILIDPVLYGQITKITNWCLMFSPVNWVSMENMAHFSWRGGLTAKYVVMAGILILGSLFIIIRNKVKKIDLFTN